METQNSSNTTFSESQMDAHIESNPWTYVNTKRQGSQSYDSHIGVLRVMFGIGDDPKEITTLISEEKTEVWAKFNTEWENLFAC